ncbi:MAG: hypothetical protein IT306_00810 [Chloroflexi bacterium]|nr:hypothetical protein [Chloroflexota bacterium]
MSGTVTMQLWVRHIGGGFATAQLAVADRRGDWQTMVGGGPRAGFQLATTHRAR